MKVIVIGAVGTTAITIEKLHEHAFEIVGVLGHEPLNKNRVAGLNNLRQICENLSLEYLGFQKINDFELLGFTNGIIVGNNIKDNKIELIKRNSLEKEIESYGKTMVDGAIDNEEYLINTYYRAIDKYKESPRYISRTKNKTSFIITKKNISDCLNDLEETFILNDKQREEILIRLNRIINHDVKIVSTQSIDITQNDLECIKKGLEDALNYQTKHVVDNNITVKEKWKKYNTSPDTYAAWLIVNNHLVLMQKPFKS